MPVFIALYWALIESVALRHAPFVGWIKILCDGPLFCFAFINGFNNVYTAKIEPTSTRPHASKDHAVDACCVHFFLLFFPAGLVVYWVSNNVLSIAQQWYITRKIEQAS